MNRTLFFSPIRQDPAILALWLRALDRVEGVDSYLFIDDNDDSESSKLLQEFVCCHAADWRWSMDIDLINNKSVYPRTGERTHEWNWELTDRIAAIRNFGLCYALKQNFDYLFTVDSDVILPPTILSMLLAAEKPIISEVYWTSWHRHYPWMPQVWDMHPYRFDSPESMLRLATPGRYRVAGLGACTLIDLDDFPPEISYCPIAGTGFLGEDRRFCIRASVCGIKLWADTTCPPFHVYYPDQLAEATAWFDAGAKSDYFHEKWINAEWRAEIRRQMKGV